MFRPSHNVLETLHDSDSQPSARRDGGFGPPHFLPQRSSQRLSTSLALNWRVNWRELGVKTVKSQAAGAAGWPDWVWWWMRHRLTGAWGLLGHGCVDARLLLLVVWYCTYNHAVGLLVFFHMFFHLLHVFFLT